MHNTPIIRICPHCFEISGDTFEFKAPPPVNASCDDCGSRLSPLSPDLRTENEGWLGDRDYSEPYDDEAFDAGEWNNLPPEPTP